MEASEWFSTGSGRIELQLTHEHARAGYHTGQCDADVEFLLTVPYIAQQLAGIPRDVLADELREYGAWDARELADHGANLARILWLACGDIVDRAAGDL